MKRLLTIALITVFSVGILTSPVPATKARQVIGSHTTVYVKGVSVNMSGSTLVVYDATRSGGGSVSNQTFTIPASSLGTVTSINALIVNDARIQTETADAETVTLYGAAVYQERIGPSL